MGFDKLIDISGLERYHDNISNILNTKGNVSAVDTEEALDDIVEDSVSNSTRSIKDAKYIASDELIYFKGHAKATYMSDGTTVEDAINNIAAGDNSSSSAAYPEVFHGTADTTFTLTPNTFHVWDEVSELNLSFGEETSGVANEFLFQFTSGSTATTLTLPDDIKWANDSVPVIEANKIYQISILKGLASVLVFSN